jgi:Transposase domain (DUF772)
MVILAVLRIDPELLLWILLIGYLYGISSERKIVEELALSGIEAAQASCSPTPVGCTGTRRQAVG